MRTTSACLLIATLAIACGDGSTASDVTPSAGGGAGGNAGAVGTGGGAGTGGTTAMGGNAGTGGTSGAGGSTGTGGTSGAGGSAGKGGSSGSGGTPGSGGSSGAGGSGGKGGAEGGTPAFDGSIPPSNASYRIAYTADGNCYAGDDLHASPMTLALIHAAKMQGAFAHMDINDNLEEGCATSPKNGLTHAANVATVATMYGFDQSLIYDDVTQLDAALAHLTALINAATSQQRLYILCAGPMEVPWRAINASDPAKRQFTTAISHSGWNDQFSGGSSIHKWKDIQATGVVTNHIENQNAYAFNPATNNYGNWDWIVGYPDGGPTLKSIATGDVSDAGMTYYTLKGVQPGATGTSQPTMADVQKFFGM